MSAPFCRRGASTVILEFFAERSYLDRISLNKLRKSEEFTLSRQSVAIWTSDPKVDKH